MPEGEIKSKFKRFFPHYFSFLIPSYSLTFIYSTWHHQQIKKSLKIPNGLSESVNRGRTDNKMAKRKKGHNDKKRYTKAKDRVTRAPLNTGGLNN
jgi:hypothetical protein